MPRLPLLVALFFLPGSLPAQDKDWKKDAGRYVQSLQTGGGGFLSMSPRPEIRIAPTLRATSSALRALHYLGGEVPNKKTAQGFVESCWDEKVGGFSDFPRGKPDVFTTAVGVMAVKELGLPLDKHKGPVTKFLSDNANGFEEIRIAAAGLERLDAEAPRATEWLETLDKDANKEGTFGKGKGMARDTASYGVTWLRLGGKIDKPDRILKVLRDGQRADGGFGKADSDTSDLETTYRVMRCFMMLKAQPKDVDALRGFIMKCRNKDGGFGVQPGENSSVGGTYFAAIVDHWLKK